VRILPGKLGFRLLDDQIIVAKSYLYQSKHFVPLKYS
jgi:hypothetical protein